MLKVAQHGWNVAEDVVCQKMQLPVIVDGSNEIEYLSQIRLSRQCLHFAIGIRTIKFHNSFQIHDSSLGGSSEDDDFLGVLRGPSSFANAFLYVGLGTVAIGLVIAFVGTGEKGFKTVELRLIGPSLIGRPYSYSREKYIKYQNNRFLSFGSRRPSLLHSANIFLYLPIKLYIV